MEYGKNGHHGACVHLLVGEAKGQEREAVSLPSMGADLVTGLKHIISLAILLFALSTDSGRSGAHGVSVR